MLELRNVRAGYGTINVLWDVSLTAAAGKLTVVIGPNGAGKTTLLRAVMGLLPTGNGDILLRGKSLADARSWQRVERGIALIPEGRMIFRELSVEENLFLGAYPKGRRAHAARGLEQAYALFPRLKERRSQLAGSLSGGEAQMLAMARGLMSDPDLLLIDEPSLGLAPVIVQELFDLLRGLKEEGKTIVLVEQNTALALEIADQVHLLCGGRIVLSEAAAKVDLAALHDLYFSR